MIEITNHGTKPISVTTPKGDTIVIQPGGHDVVHDIEQAGGKVVVAKHDENEQPANGSTDGA